MENEITTTSERIKPDTKVLWKTFWILLGLTGLEFLIAFTVDADKFKWSKISLFVLLTIFKAYYIIATFMHLKHETKVFKRAFIFPIIIGIWFITALIMEGDYFGLRRFIDINLWLNH